jgi:cyclase
MTAGRTSPHFRLETLAPGVYAAIATPLGYGLCNSGIVDLGDDTLVFDTMLTPPAGRDLVRAAKHLTGRRPTWAVNSHWHGDHIWGNSSFMGSHIVSSGVARTTILKRSQRQFDSDRREMRGELRHLDAANSRYSAADRPLMRAWFEGVVRMPPGHRIVAPNVTFEDRLVLEGRRRSVHLLTYGGGHSPSDVFAYLPEEQIVLGGDLAIRGFHPSVGDGWPDRWVAILRRIERLRVRSVLPGHGAPDSADTLAETRRYLESIDRSARAARRRGTPLRDFLRTPIPGRFRDWRFSFMFEGNLARAYRLAAHR